MILGTQKEWLFALQNGLITKNEDGSVNALLELKPWSCCLLPI